MSEQRELWVVSLGTMAYGAALELQRSLAHERISGTIPEDILLLVEHPPVVTLGRSTKARNLISSADFLESRGVELFEVERGGDVTFHGPGQLVGYPIVDLKQHRLDLHWYLRQVEEALIRTLAAYSIPAERNVGFTGVWTRGRKIASIGVHARDWVTWHGFALNVRTDLSYFDLIIPCGIDGVTMTSIERELRGSQSPPVSVEAAGRIAAREFGILFDLHPVVVDRRTLSHPATMTEGASPAA
jgi:lipoate-protein ligase B